MLREGLIAVVGATGAVGREALAILAERGVPASRVRALASERSHGLRVRYGETEVGVATLDERSFEGVGTAVFAADAATARRFVPIALGAGAFVVDNSSAFRADPGVPLVIPEINGRLVTPDARLVANPNCSTTILLLALEPLRRAFGVDAIDVATYQAVSGAGLAGIESLVRETRESLATLDREGPEIGWTLAGISGAGGVFAEPCAFNVFSHDSAVDAATGVNGEERKMIDETRRIWADATIRVTPTCVRVPALRAHTQAITVTLSRAAGEGEVLDALARGRGLEVVDDRGANAFPTPRKAAGRDEVLVGRVRPDPGEPPGQGGTHRRWCLLASGDQLRKGAALNALQIAGLTTVQAIA
ncbi:MAG TPA: aspartate-semialdehyde dehydrogenase [Phycisphaerales bacterium]|nr:aspartate-semialdehyde dehydrogenase [Phycisphaerales bacterium]